MAGGYFLISRLRLDWAHADSFFYKFCLISTFFSLKSCGRDGRGVLFDFQNSVRLGPRGRFHLQILLHFTFFPEKVVVEMGGGGTF